jgi:HEPN domain-containing protein
VDQRAQVKQHFDHAAHNERLLDLMVQEVLPKAPEFADWAMIVMFYAALHYTKGAILRDHALYVPRHRSFRDALGEVDTGHNDLVREHMGEEVATAYTELFDASQQARYRSFFTKSTEALNEVTLLRVQLQIVREACLTKS